MTFAETRRHLGVETQRQWSDRAIARTTPALLGLFSLVALWAGELQAAGALTPQSTRWYDKPQTTFSDALAAVRRTLWMSTVLRTSEDPTDMVEVARSALERLTQTACHPA